MLTLEQLAPLLLLCMVAALELNSVKASQEDVVLRVLVLLQTIHGREPPSGAAQVLRRPAACSTAQQQRGGGVCCAMGTAREALLR